MRVILTLGNDIKQEILRNYICSSNPHLKKYYENTLNLIYDFVYDDLEELIDLGFNDEDMDILGKCVYDLNPLLIIRCNEFIEGYTIEME